MKQSEDATKPILEPLMTGTAWNRWQEGSAALAPSDQETLARWAYKTLLAAELQISRSLPYVVPREEYRRFYSDRSPARCQIWLGLYASRIVGFDGDSALAVRRQSFGVPVRTLQTGPPTFLAQILAPRAPAYSATIQIGAAVFHLVGHASDLEFEVQPEVVGLLLPIWPQADQSIKWPPLLALGDEDLDRFLTKPTRGGVTVDPSITVEDSDGNVVHQGTGEAVSVDPVANRNRPKTKRKGRAP
jgi:hypothetical protein